jgi:hypothetical protein
MLLVVDLLIILLIILLRCAVARSPNLTWLVLCSFDPLFFSPWEQLLLQ